MKSEILPNDLNPSYNEYFSKLANDLHNTGQLNSFIGKVINDDYNLEDIDNIFLLSSEPELLSEIVSEHDKNNNKETPKKEKVKKKRGRKTTKKGDKKVHSSSDFDNIMRKIQVHFLGYVTDLINEIIYSFLKNKNIYCYKFNYSDKKNIKYDFVETLKKCNIKELFLKIKASPKYKRISSNNNENINEPILNYLIKYSWFNEFINKSFSDIFKIYFNNQKYINIEGRKIKIGKARNFHILLQKNEENRKQLVEVAEIVYLRDDS